MNFIGGLPESSTQGLLIGKLLVGGLGVVLERRAHRQQDEPPQAVASPSAPANLPTKIIPAKIARRKLSAEFPMGLVIPPLKIKITLESDPRILVRRLAVMGT